MGVLHPCRCTDGGPLLHAKFHPHRCNVSPLRGEKPQNWPLSKLNTGRFALRAMLPVISYFFDRGIQKITSAQQQLRWATVPEQWAEKCVCVAGAAVPLSVVGGAGAGSPSVASKTTSPEPRPISVPRGILHHSTVWPQYFTLRTDRTGQTDRQTDRQTTVR